MLIPLVENVWTAAAPLRFFGLEMGTRMSVVKLPSGGLLLHSPIALSPALKEQIDELGEVEHIVAPNTYHHLFAGDLAKEYPEARVVAPRALRKKRPNLRIDAELEELQASDFGNAVDGIHIGGTGFHETVLIHTPSRTLFSADLLENFETSDHTLTRWYLSAFGLKGKTAVGLPLRVFYRDRKVARKAIDQMLERDFERVVVAHGEVLEESAKEETRRAFEWLR